MRPKVPAATTPPAKSLPEQALAVLHSVARAFQLLWTTSAPLTAALAGLSLLAGVLPAGIAVVGRALVDGVVRAIESGRAADRAVVLRYVLLELGLVAVLGAAHRGLEVSQTILRARLGQRISEMIIEKALTLSLADFEDPEFYDRMNRAAKGSGYRPLSLLNALFGLIRDAILLGTFCVLLLRVSPWLVLIVVLAAVPEFVLETRFSSETFRLFNWRSAETRRQGYLETLLTREDHAKEVRLFGLGPLLLARYREIFARFWREDQALTVRRGAWGFAIGLVGTGAFYGAYSWVAYAAMERRITLGELSMYLLILRQGQSTVSSVLGTLGGAYDDHRYLSVLFEFLAHPAAQRDDGVAQTGPDPADGLRFDDVTFAYPGAPHPVLAGVTLHVPAGRKLAIVGENGAGKTTLIKLLTRLYSPTSGRILLDGRDLAEWDRGALWRRIGVIFQDFVRYQFIVGENIGVGDVTALADEERWREAAERGMADEFIRELPAAYHTQLGHWFADGQELSVGQWQKIALSRAFMRTAADILVLDEPTASMDAEAEARVFQRFRALAATRTAILISHRFSTVRMADSIVVLAGGKVLEQGTHDELIVRNGRYAELFHLQAKGYR